MAPCLPHSRSLSANANFLSSPPPLRTAPWLLGWAELLSDPSVQCHCPGKHGPIMAINNNRRVHLAWWLMGLFYSSLTWLFCSHQQLPAHIMLNKWTLDRILYDSRVEQRHQEGLDLSVGRGKEVRQLFQKMSAYVLLYTHRNVSINMQVCTMSVRVEEREIQVCPSALISLTWREVDCVYVVGWKSNHLHIQTHTLKIPYMHLSDTGPLTTYALIL